MRAVRLILCALLLGLVGPALAAMDAYEFESPEQKARFQILIEELRCPKCQNQNLADSNAPIAKDLRDRTYSLVREGRSDAEIRDYLIERYGEFISYRPPFRGATALLWAGPFVLLAVVLGILVWRIRRRASKAATPMSAAEEARLQALLTPPPEEKGQ